MSSSGYKRALYGYVNGEEIVREEGPRAERPYGTQKSAGVPWWTFGSSNGLDSRGIFNRIPSEKARFCVRQS
jgi:hypothetical protein